MRRLVIIGVVVSVLGALMASGAFAEPADTICKKGGAWKDFGFQSQRACLLAESEGLLWSLEGDFRIGGAEENPSVDRYGNPDVWSYMRGATATPGDPSTYSLLPNYGGVVEQNPAGKDWTDSREGWQGDDCDGVAWIGYPWVVWHKEGAAGAVRMHPADPFCSDYTHSIVGWTSPYTGQITITGEVHGNPGAGPSADGIEWQLRRTGTTSPSELLDSGSFEPLGEDTLGVHVINVTAGDTVYLIVSPKANNGWDYTDATLTIKGTG